MRGERAFALLTVAAVALSGCFGTPPNAPPVVNAHASAATAAAGEEVIFTGTGVDTDGSVVRFEWDFTSDGVPDFANATKATAAFRYPLPGAFHATFTAFDDTGASSSVTVNVTIVARFNFNADWGEQAGFAVHGAATLDPGLLLVTALPSGAPAPFTFRIGEGLVPVNNTTYRVAIPATQLQRYSTVRLEAIYNATPSGSRIFRSVPFFGSENDSVVTYHAVMEDTRALASGNSTLSATGSMSAQAAGNTSVMGFAGTATATSSYADPTGSSNASYALSSLAWNRSLSLTTGTFSTTDYAWFGTGRLTSTATGGFSTDLNLTEYRGTRYRGNLTFLRADGSGHYWSTASNSNGTVAYAVLGNTSVDALDGEGVSRKALVIVENQTYNGTLSGAPYLETNVSKTYEAVAEALENPELFVSWNTSGMIGSSPLSGSGSRFLDANGDGTFNPDPRPTLPFDGQFFVGLAPADLEVGDAFTVHNGAGGAARLEASNLRTEALVAPGFANAAVQTVTLSGAISGGGFTGSISADIVATGAHNQLRLRYDTTLASATGSLSSHLTLQARGA